MVCPTCGMGSVSSGVETSLFDPAICDLHIAECSNRASLERGSARNSVERHSRRLNPVGQKVLVRSVSRRKTVADIASGCATSESTVRSQLRGVLDKTVCSRQTRCRGAVCGSFGSASQSNQLISTKLMMRVRTDLPIIPDRWKTIASFAVLNNAKSTWRY
jgi:DNA-binding CsgD family transcriptional regulator